MSLRNPVESTPPLSRQVYVRMRDAILGGEFPAGTRLSPAVLAEKLGVSTMPVREAIRMLQDDGLVETSARRWTRVASAVPELADEVYPLVGLLESYAIEHGEPPSRERLARMRAANRKLDEARRKNEIAACIDADTSFHAVLLEGSQNETLLRIIDDLKARIRLLEGTFFQSEYVEPSIAQHRKIITALAKGALDEAAEMVRSNWAHGLIAVRAAFASSEAGPG